MTHSNVATHIGACATCRREQVELHPSAQEDRRTGERQLNCVDEFACFEAWRALNLA